MTIKKEKIETLKQYLPQDERNYKIVTTTRDGNELLKWIGPQLNQKSHIHFFLLYDPYNASIDWNALMPFFRNWSEVLINHMVSDSVRAISQVKKENKKKKYEETYQVESISELLPYGSDKAAYEKRVIDIIQKMKGSASRIYCVAAFPFFNTWNSLVYDLVHCTSHEKGFKLFKSTAWKIFNGKSSSKNRHGMENQLEIDFSGEGFAKPVIDKYCYDLNSIAAYLQENFYGRKDVPFEEVWAILDEHPVFPSDGYRQDLKRILGRDCGAKISQKTITFSGRRGL